MSEKLPRVDGQQLIRALERAGFERVRQKGSHVHLRRESDRRRVTVPVHKGKTLPPGTLQGILRDAGVNAEKLRQLL
jgi:predicted RNA binding protein YcfA (HicA-like mRNA interferase family)